MSRRKVEPTGVLPVNLEETRLLQQSEVSAGYPHLAPNHPAPFPLVVFEAKMSKPGRPLSDLETRVIFIDPTRCKQLVLDLGHAILVAEDARRGQR